MSECDEATAISEDHSRRSECIAKLFATSQPFRVGAGQGKDLIPRILVQYWHDLFLLPSDVKSCIDSWQSIEFFGFERLLFDDKTARDYIRNELGNEFAKAFDRCHHPAMRCDYFRLCYIYKSGGFYVDADEHYRGTTCDSLITDARLKLQPLCYDNLSGQMVPAKDFFTAPESCPRWTLYVNNNPLIASARHPVVEAALNRATLNLSRQENLSDIQSITGPGNLTACLVWHYLSQNSTDDRSFCFLPSWDTVASTIWNLSYRNDERNWRLWSPGTQGNRL